MTGFSRGLLGAPIFLWMAGCADLSSTAESEAVFANPAAYVGRQVRLCGYIHDRFEDTNIWPDRRSLSRDGSELGFLDDHTRRIGRLDGKSTCINVEIVRTGCGHEENGTVTICTSIGSQFAARRIQN